MKKIISIILAATVSIAAYAKTAEQMATETSGLSAAQMKVYVAENLVDMKAVFDAWKVTDEAKSGTAKWSNKLIRLCYFYAVNQDSIDAEPIALVTLGAWNLPKLLAESNPTFYDEVKAAGFKVGNVSLTPAQAAWLARTFNDKAYIGSLSADFVATNIADKYGVIEYIKIKTPVWLAATDLAAAKAEVSKIENALIAAGDTSDLLTKVQSIQRALTQRMVDAKILGM